MAFQLEKLFVDVFAPLNGDVVTVMYDLPHGEIRDHDEWQERREMVASWQRQIIAFSKSYGVLVNPIVTYDATGSDNSDMPEYGMCQGERIRIEDIIRDVNLLPYCYTLQSCYGHFLYQGQSNPHSLTPLPVTNDITEVDYRIAYIAMVIENSEEGRALLEDIKQLTDLNPYFIQFGCADWFWNQNVNSYALQVEPKDHMYKPLGRR